MAFRPPGCPAQQFHRQHERSDLRHVAKIGNVCVVMSQNSRWERLNFCKPGCSPSECVPSNARSFDARANTSEFHNQYSHVVSWLGVCFHEF